MAYMVEQEITQRHRELPLFQYQMIQENYSILVGLAQEQDHTCLAVASQLVGCACITSVIAALHLDRNGTALVLLLLFHPSNEISHYLVCEHEKMMNLGVRT